MKRKKFVCNNPAILQSSKKEILISASKMIVQFLEFDKNKQETSNKTEK